MGRIPQQRHPTLGESVDLDLPHEKCCHRLFAGRFFYDAFEWLDHPSCLDDLDNLVVSVRGRFRGLSLHPFHPIASSGLLKLLLIFINGREKPEKVCSWTRR
jgi:hypothetical protein